MCLLEIVEQANFSARMGRISERNVNLVLPIIPNHNNPQWAPLQCGISLLILPRSVLQDFDVHGFPFTFGGRTDETQLFLLTYIVRWIGLFHWLPPLAPQAPGRRLLLRSTRCGCGEPAPASSFDEA